MKDHILPLHLAGGAGRDRIRTIYCSRAKFRVEIADTWFKIAKGLMFRRSLPKDEGMLFIFEKEGMHSIWMWGMMFSLDILWMDRDGKVIRTIENAPASGIFGESLVEYFPPSNAKYVLELNAGSIRHAKITLGDRFSL